MGAGSSCRFSSPSRLTTAKLVTLRGNIRPEANSKNDRGAVPDDFPMAHMLLQLKRAPQLEKEFAAFIETLTDKSSPNFRHWMLAAEQGEKYGVWRRKISTPSPAGSGRTASKSDTSTPIAW